MKISILFLSLIFILPDLNCQKLSSAKIINLDLDKAFNKQEEIPISRLVDKVTFTILENNPIAPVASFHQVEVTNEFVIVRQQGGNRNWQILLFDRKSGKFLREIGKQGRGPGEFMMYSLIPFNPIKEEIYAIDSQGNLLVYNTQGVYLGSVKMPNPAAQPAAFNSIVDGNIFVVYVGNASGNEKRKLILTNSDGTIKIFPNYLTWDAEQFWNSTQKRGFLPPPPWGFSKFYTWDNKTNFIEIYCDTLYQLTKNLLIPRYYFNWGKYNAPYSKQIWATDSKNAKNYFFITDIFENAMNIFTRIYFNDKDYTSLVDKKKNNFIFCRIGDSGISGFHDDINNLMDIIPQGVTPNNELTWVIEPIKLLKWLKENPDKARLAESRLPWLKTIDEFSNPIVAVAKCK